MNLQWVIGLSKPSKIKTFEASRMAIVFYLCNFHGPKIMNFRICISSTKQNLLTLRSYKTSSALCVINGKIDAQNNGSRCFEDEYNRSHVSTNTFQKTLLSVGAATISLLNPRRADMIAVLGETTGDYAIQYMRNKMLDSEEGKSILEEKPRINSKTVDLKMLENLPEGTIGKVYSDFLKNNNVTPDSRDVVQFIDDIESAYVIQRYREVHDLFHTVLGMPTNMLGEVTVKWVEAIQTRLPMCIGGAVFGAVRLAPKMFGCTSYRFYSTQEKLTEEVENDETEDNSSGNMKIKPVSLPENIENNIKLLLENYPLPQLKQDSEYLRRYVSCRKPPAQKSAVENLRNRALEKFEQKYPADPSLMSEDVLNFYEENKRSFVNKFVSQNLYNWKPITYNEYHSLLHLYAHSVPQYAVIFKILYEITKRDEQFSPISMFDFGSGVGINTWAAYKYWSKSIIEYYCVDNSSIIQNVAHSILTSNNENKKPFINNVYFRQFLPETSRPYDIVFCTYSLMELPAQSSRLKVLTNLWNKTKKYLVLVEVGTLAGFNLITEARDYILQSDNDCHVFGPCTHDVTCPRTFDTTPCNFFVKYQPLKLTEINQVKVELYSYVVLKKGPRSQDNNESYSRIVRAVLPRHKHVVCKLCTCEGKLNDTYFTKRKNGKEIYKIVRKSNWGDIIPTKFNKDVAVNGSLSSGDDDIDDTG